MVSNHKVVYRGLMVHGRLLLRECEYSEEIALLHSLRVMEEYTRKVKDGTEMYHEAVIAAGTPRVHVALRKWWKLGELELTSAAATPLVDDFYRLKT